MSETIYNIVNEVADERLKQNEKWGQQDHASVRGERARGQFAVQAETWKQINDARVAGDEIHWDGILLEEVFEALECKTEAEMRGELIQVAAVAVAWVEAIDRRLAQDALSPAVDDSVA